MRQTQKYMTMRYRDGAEGCRSELESHPKAGQVKKSVKGVRFVAACEQVNQLIIIKVCRSRPSTIQ